VVVYSNLVPSPFWLVIALNVMLMLGVMSRMVPAMALITSLPKAQDRGAFMSINSSLQYISGGIAAAIGGMIIEQKTANSPLEHFNLLGYLVVAVAAVCIFLVFRVSKIISQRTD
jgi:predicted MFS family arabinose efflux permease